MKIAFDVDVLAKQMSINDYVHKVADWGYKYIEQSPHPRINPFYKHPLFSKECQQEYKQALKETGVEISSFIVVYRWSGPTEEQRQHAVANWKRMIEIAVDMGVPVINTEFSGDPNQQEICNGMFFKSMEELLPIIEREGIRVECQSHPYDFVELNDEACDIVKSFRSKNLGYVYSASHGFFYDQGKGDVRHMLKYAGDELTHVLLADTWNQTKDCRYIVNPPWLNQHGRADYTIHQHTAMGEGEVDFDGIFETLREMDFANKQLKPDAPKVGGDNIICVSYFGFPEKMDQQAPRHSTASSTSCCKEYFLNTQKDLGFHSSPLRLSRNYSFADKQDHCRVISKVVRKFLYRNFLPPEVQNGDTCSPFLSICRANAISCALPREMLKNADYTTFRQTEGLEFSLKSFFHTVTKRHFSRQEEWNARCRAN